jgi:hypothetical protein
MRVPDKVGDENNEHTGLVMMHVARDRDIDGLSMVDAAIDPNVGDGLYHICELGKGVCDVLKLVQVNGVNDEDSKVIFESLGQSRGLIRQIEVAKAFSGSSSTVFRRWRGLGLIAAFCGTVRRRQEVSVIVKAAAAVPLRSVCPCPAGEIDEECGGDGEEAPAQAKADSVVSVWASMVECSAGRETVLAGVRDLAEELDQARNRSQAKQSGGK